jgi:hypothetical protein
LTIIRHSNLNSIHYKIHISDFWISLFDFLYFFKILRRLNDFLCSSCETSLKNFFFVFNRAIDCSETHILIETTLFYFKPILHLHTSQHFLCFSVRIIILLILFTLWFLYLIKLFYNWNLIAIISLQFSLH